jgi:hypothetical protein
VVNFYFFNGVGEHSLEGLDFLDDVVNVLLLILAEEMLIFFHILGELPLEFLRLLFIEDSSSFLFFIELLEVDLVLYFWDVEDGSQVLDCLHALVYGLILL